MTITASLVKDLRERTGVGMMECKKALAAANGDIEKAIERPRSTVDRYLEAMLGYPLLQGLTSPDEVHLVCGPVYHTAPRAFSRMEAATISAGPAVPRFTMTTSGSPVITLFRSALNVSRG